MNLFFCSDHAGYALKEALWNLYPDALNLGTHTEDAVDYPLLAKDAAFKAREGYLGILICGTGIGMSISANRFPFVRAALCTNPYEARMARAHNDANILCLGARVIGLGLATMCVEVFLTTSFEERHRARVEMLGAGYNHLIP